MKTINIDKLTISEQSKPYIIAEIGVNHYDIAKKHGIDPYSAAELMISEASKAGADAVKFQTYKAEKIASINSPAYWDLNKEKTTSQYELFKKFDDFEIEDYAKLAKYSNSKGATFLSTPFDFESADGLESFMPAFKISSSDINNIPFISHIAKKEKPILLSTGASNINEIKNAVSTIEKERNYDIAVMHCILNYPTRYEDANLGMINDLKKSFPEYLIGYSDHTLPDPSMLVLTTAALFGAKIIEKHFTLDKSLEGNDHYHAMDPSDLKKFVDNINFIENITGKTIKEPLESEMPSRLYARRSLVTNREIPKGKPLKSDMITFKRPGTGIGPENINTILGKKVNKTLPADHIIMDFDIED